MSLIKGKQEFRTILDFSKGKWSKNKIKQALRDVEVLELVQLKGSGTYTFVENQIQVGMYQVRLAFYSLDSTCSRSRLRHYGGLRVEIGEGSTESPTSINTVHDKRFKEQYWSKMTHSYDIRMNTLTDIIMHLHRLNNLKMFL